MEKTSKKSMTLEEHQALGMELYRMRERLMGINLTLGNDHYPLTTQDAGSRAYRRLVRALKELDLARSAMDDQIGRDCRGVDDHTLCDAYYPGARLHSQVPERAEESTANSR